MAGSPSLGWVRDVQGPSCSWVGVVSGFGLVVRNGCSGGTVTPGVCFAPSCLSGSSLVTNERPQRGSTRFFFGRVRENVSEESVRSSPPGSPVKTQENGKAGSMAGG